MNFSLQFKGDNEYAKWTKVRQEVYSTNISQSSSSEAWNKTPRLYLAERLEVSRENNPPSEGLPRPMTDYIVTLYNLVQFSTGSPAPHAGYVVITYNNDLGETVPSYTVRLSTSENEAWSDWRYCTYLGKNWQIRFSVVDNMWLKPYRVNTQGVSDNYMQYINLTRTLVTNLDWNAYPYDGLYNGDYYQLYDYPSTFTIDETRLLNGVDYEQVASSADSLRTINMAYAKISFKCYLEPWMKVQGRQCEFYIDDTKTGIFTIVSANYNNRTNYYEVLGYDNMYKLQDSAENWAKHYSETFGVYEHYYWADWYGGGSSYGSRWSLYYNTDGSVSGTFDADGNFHVTYPSRHINVGSITQSKLDEINNCVAGAGKFLIMYPEDYSPGEGSIIIYSQVTLITLDSSGYIHVNGLHTSVSNTTDGVWPASKFTRYRNYESSDLTLGNKLQRIDSDIFVNLSLNSKQALPIETTTGAVLSSIVSYLGLQFAYSGYSNLAGDVKYTYTNPSEVGSFAEVINNLFASFGALTIWCDSSGKILLGGYGYYMNSNLLMVLNETTLNNTQYVNFMRSQDTFTTANNVDIVRIKCSAINDFVVTESVYYLENGVIKTVDSPWVREYNQTILQDSADILFNSLNSSSPYSSNGASLNVLDFSNVIDTMIFGKIIIHNECNFYVLEKRINASGVTLSCNINFENREI